MAGVRGCVLSDAVRAEYGMIAPIGQPGRVQDLAEKETGQGYDSATAGGTTRAFPSFAKNRSTTSSFRVRVIAGSAVNNNLPYGLSASRVSQIISTPRSVSLRISRPAPCFRLIAACGN